MAGKMLPGSVLYPGLLALALIIFGRQLYPVEGLPESIPEPVVSEQAPISVFPDFAAVVEVDERKQQFFQFLREEDYTILGNGVFRDASKWVKTPPRQGDKVSINIHFEGKVPSDRRDERGHNSHRRR